MSAAEEAAKIAAAKKAADDALAAAATAATNKADKDELDKEIDKIMADASVDDTLPFWDSIVAIFDV